MILFCTKTTLYCTSSDGNRKSVILTDVYWRILLFCLHSNLLWKKKNYFQWENGMVFTYFAFSRNRRRRFHLHTVSCWAFDLCLEANHCINDNQASSPQISFAVVKSTAGIKKKIIYPNHGKNHIKNRTPNSRVVLQCTSVGLMLLWKWG